MKCVSVTLTIVRLFIPKLTVVQSNKKYSLDHVIDIKLFTKFLAGSEGAVDLCHRVVMVLNTV